MPGEQLRSAREGRGMSLDEAARQTCIGISYLEALEAGRYGELPNPAYVKGIIRSYARVLGIPPEPLVARYTQGAEPDELDNERSGGGGVPQGKRSWLLLMIIGVVIIAGYMLAQRDTGQVLPPAPAGQAVSSVLPGQGGLPQRASPVRSVPPPEVPANQPQREEAVTESVPAPAPGNAVLKARIISECQLTMTVDDMPSQQYELKPGDVVEWIGERHFVLELTDAGAIETELNGRPLPPLGRSGDAATVVITADGQVQ